MKILVMVVLQIIFLLITPLAFAEITLTIPEKETYNIGDKIVPTVSVKEDKDYEGFFSMYIICDNYELQYYTIPLDLETGSRTQVPVLPLPLSKSMIGECKLKANYESNRQEMIEKEQSDDFYVTDELIIEINGILEALPGDDVILTGEVKKQSGEALSDGVAEITFLDKKTEVDIVSGEFKYETYLDSNADAGIVPLNIAVTDNHENRGDNDLKFNIIPIPTRIENRFENNVLMPEDTLRARVILYDHNDKIIDGSRINIRIFYPDESLLAQGGIESMNYFVFETGKNQIPGTYFLLSEFEDIKEQSTFEIPIVEKMIMEQEGNFVHVENIGNVDYIDEITLIVENEDGKYVINRKIDLDPGEKITVDLSKEVPQGIYDILLPEENVRGSESIIRDVKIDDNRPFFKKISSGMSAVTGAAVSTANYVASKPLLATTILILIILGTVTYYSRDFVISRIKGKKKDDISHLFEDYKFEDKK